MRHLLTDSAPTAGEKWEGLLQRLADKTSAVNTASALIDALTTPLPDGGEEPAQKHRRLSIHRRQSAAQAELVDSLTTPTSAKPANKLDFFQFQDIGPLKCRTCNADYVFTAGELRGYHHAIEQKF